MRDAACFRSENELGWGVVGGGESTMYGGNNDRLRSVLELEKIAYKKKM